MKMKLFTLAALSLFTIYTSRSQALLYNNNATIKIEAGATLYVEGNVENAGTGIIENDGLLDIKGDFLNGPSATWDGSDPNTLKFSGTGNSTLTPNSAVFQDVVVAKESTFNLILAGNTTVNDSLIFSSPGSTRIETGNNTLILGTNAKVGGHGSNEYVATTGTGMMQKNVSADGIFEFPIGDITNYSPLAADYTGSAYASANLKARVNDLTHPNKPSDATDFISRYWDINQTGITGYENTLTGTYIAADLTGTAAKGKGAVHDGTNWDFFDASQSGLTVTGSTMDAMADFTGMNFYGKVDLIAILAGAYNTTTHLMSTTFSTNATIEALMLNSPYTDAPASVTDVPTDVTDWIKIELRDPASPTTVLGMTSAFIKKDGSIVGLDGTSLPLIKDGLPVSIVKLVHRNHLAIRTPNSGIDVVGPAEHNFTTGLDKAYDNVSNTVNDAMRLMSDGTYALFGGNANTSGTGINTLRYFGFIPDPVAITNALGGNNSASLTNVYNSADLNFNGTVRYFGFQPDPPIITQNLGGNNSLIFNAHQ